MRVLTFALLLLIQYSSASAGATPLSIQTAGASTNIARDSQLPKATTASTAGAPHLPSQTAGAPTNIARDSQLPKATTAPTAVVSSPAREIALEKQLMEQEAAYLRKQMESVEQYHESVLATAYFAVGTVFTITILVLGYSWWFYPRAYENDKATLRQELTTKLEAAEDRISLKEQSQRTASEAALGARLDSMTTAHSEGATQLRKELASVRTSAETAVSGATKKLDWLFKEFRVVEEMVWALSGADQNALLSLAQALDMCARDEDDDMFDVIADRFEMRVSEMVKSGTKINSESESMIKKTLTKSMALSADKTQRILQQLARVSEPASS